MKSAVIFALAGTSLAVPFGNAIKAIYGDGLEARQATPSGVEPTAFPTSLFSGFPTGLPSGFPSGIPFPSGTGHHHHHHHHPSGVRPTGSRPSGRPGHQSGRHSKSLAIDYKLAPTALAKYKVEERQVGSGSAALPSFTLVNPSDAVPTASSSDAAVPTVSDAPSFPTPTSGGAFPTGFPTDLPSGFPTGLPTGGFPHPTGAFPHPSGGFPHPTGGFPHPSGGFPHPTGVFPTTLATFTRGPKPTSMPTQESDETDEQSWLEWIEGIIGAAKGKVSN